MFKSPAQAVRLMALTGAAVVALAAQPALAADTAELEVSATVSGVCNVTTTPVAFGAIDVTTVGNTDATGSYSVVCTSGTAWTAAADAGNGATASVAVRKMTSGANLLNYGLFTDIGRATNFATGAGPGTGAEELTTIYGRVPSGQVVPAGSYADSVTISRPTKTVTTVGKKHRSGVRSIVSIAACSWLILGATFGVPASASSLKVNPVHINLPAGSQSVALKMSNGDSAPASVRVTTFGWTQVGGRDVYTPTNNVLVSPPIFTIPAGKTQLVRIGLRSPNGAGAYRVIFEEIPAQKLAGGRIQVTLKLNLPLYVLPPGGGKTDVSWSAWRDGTGELIVQGRNRGTLHSQVTQLQADLPGGPQTLSREMGVVLPGSARQWKAGKRPDFAAGAPLLLKVRSSAGETQTQIVVEQR